MTAPLVNQKYKDTFAVLRTGDAFENAIVPLIDEIQPKITSLLGSCTTLLLTATTEQETVIEALQVLLESLDTALTELAPHSHTLTGSQDPAGAQYSFQTRMSVLEASMGLVEGDLDPTDTDTKENKVTKIFGRLLDDTYTDTLESIDMALNSLIADASDIIDFVATASELSEDLENDTEVLTSGIAGDNSNLVVEINRLKDFGATGSLIGQAKDPLLQSIFSKVGSNDLKTVLGLET